MDRSTLTPKQLVIVNEFRSSIELMSSEPTVRGLGRLHMRSIRLEKRAVAAGIPAEAMAAYRRDINQRRLAR